jgi:DnaJ family protein C protein 11
VVWLVSLQAELLGFYDPCVGEEKELSVTYEFNRRRYVCVFKENDRILIPSAG